MVKQEGTQANRGPGKLGHRVLTEDRAREWASPNGWIEELAGPNGRTVMRSASPIITTGGKTGPASAPWRVWIPNALHDLPKDKS